MNYLLDTNVVVETVRPRPDKTVINWLDSVQQDSLWVSVLTIGEIRKGLAAMSGGQRKTLLMAWLEGDLINWFGGNLLPVDLRVADSWGYLCSKSKNQLPVIDSLLAATALTHNLKLVTRNVSNFNYPGLLVINPWKADMNP